MREYKIKISYARKGTELKEFEVPCTEYPAPYLVDSFVIEQIMLKEEPDMISIYPPLVDIHRGAEPQKMPTNLELAKLHGIENLVYEIEGRKFIIQT